MRGRGRSRSSGQRVVRSRAGADPEVETSARDDVDGGGDLGQHGGRAEAVTGDEQAEPKALGLRSHGREQRPAFVDRSVRVATNRVATDRHAVVEEPRMLNLGNLSASRQTLCRSW